MNIAVVGAGKWGRNLVENFSQLGVLKKIIDSDESKYAELKTKYPGVLVTADLNEAFKSDIDAVGIATPASTHFELAKLSLSSQKATFVEKPMTLKSHEAEELCRLAEKENLVLMTGHLLLYQPAIQWLKSQIMEKKWGALRSLHQERLNLGQARNVENVLWSLGVHDVAVLLFLVSSPVQDVKFSGQRILQSGIEDDTYLHLNFENGVQGHLHNSWLWPERRRQLTLVFDQAMVVYDELKQEVTLHRKLIGKDLKNKDEGTEVVFSGDAQPLRLELENFLNCIKTKSTPISSGRSALEVIKVLEKAR